MHYVFLLTIKAWIKCLRALIKWICSLLIFIVYFFPRESEAMKHTSWSYEVVRCVKYSSKGSFTLRLFSARLTTVTGKSQSPIGRQRQSTNNQSESSNHSHESRTRKSQCKHTVRPSNYFAALLRTSTRVISFFICDRYLHKYRCKNELIYLCISLVYFILHTSICVQAYSECDKIINIRASMYRMW